MACGHRLTCLDERDLIKTAYLDTDADFEKFRNYSLLKREDVL